MPRMPGMGQCVASVINPAMETVFKQTPTQQAGDQARN